MTQPVPEDLPLRHVLSLAEIPPNGVDVRLNPGESERATLAQLLEVSALPAFSALIHVAPEGAEGLHVTGTVEATVVQICGVTLEPFEAAVHEEIDVHFVPEGTVPPPESEEDEAYDPPDEIIGGAVDIGSLAAEFLALGIDPYPRKPGAVFEAPPEDAAAASPFAALARLKGEGEG